MDLGRILAALAVITIHSSGNYLWRYNEPLIWNEASILNCFSRFCVPLFVMMSGALILKSPIDDWVAFMRRRSAAVLKPYLFATAFYLLWQTLYQHAPPTSANEYAKTIVKGVPFFHLYFLWLILGMYIIAPILDGVKFVKTSNLVLTVSLLFLISATERYLLVFGYNLGLLTSVSSYLPYFVCGYVVVYRLNVPLTVAIITFLASTITTILITSVSSAMVGASAGITFQEYDSLNVVLQSVSLLCILQRISILNTLARRVIHGFAKVSLGIFILHFAVLSMLLDFVRHYALIYQPLEPFLMPILTFIICAAIVRTLHFIPPMKGFI